MTFVFFFVFNTELISTSRQIVVIVAFMIIRAITDFLLICSNYIMSFVLAALNTSSTKVLEFGSLFILDASKTNITLVSRISRVKCLTSFVGYNILIGVALL